MKLVFACLIFVLSFVGSSVLAQAPFPEVSAVTALPDTANRTLNVRYNLKSNGSAQLRVALVLSTDSGKTFLYTVKNATGDVGFPVSPGNNKEIVWQYGSSLVPAFSQNFQAKVVAIDPIPVKIEDLVAQVDSFRYKRNLKMLFGKRNHETDPTFKEASKDSIESYFAAAGLSTFRDEFTVDNYVAQNLVGFKSGTTDAANLYMLGAHFDTVKPSPGADDNGTGVAALLEIIEILKPYHLEKSLKVVGFDMEEYNLLGSANYVEMAMPEYETLKGLINMDMIGYYDNKPNSQKVPEPLDFFQSLFPQFYDSLNNNQFRGDFIMNVADENSTELMAQLDSASHQYVPGLRIYSGSVPAALSDLMMRNDCASFWLKGYPAVLLNDGGAEYRNPNYHKAADTLGSINYDFATKVTKAALAAIAKIAGVQHSRVALSEPFTLNVNIGFTDRAALETPPVARLDKVFPNPFAETIEFQFIVEKKQLATLQIFDLNGRFVAEIWNQNTEPGCHKAVWNGTNPQGQEVAQGVYFCKLVSGNHVETRKIMYLKAHQH